MFISSIELTNFKSIGASARKIDFAPITMLFGANGIGKSTVLHALGYLYEIFINKNLNPSQLTTCDSINSGGFKGLINGNDLSKEMTFSVELVGEGKFSPAYGDYPRTDALKRKFIDLGIYIGPVSSQVSNPIGHVNVAFSLKFDDSKDEVSINNFELMINGQKTCSITRSKKAAFVENFNFEHSIFRLDDCGLGGFDWDVEERFDEIKGFNTAKALRHQFRDLKVNEHQIELTSPDLIDLVAFGDSHWLFSFAEEIDIEHFETEFSASAAALSMAIKTITLEPIIKLEESLKHLIHIGPIRTIPGLYFEPSNPVAKQGWYSGKSAWDNLFLCPNLVDRVNDSLKTVMGLDHSIVIKKFDDLSHLRLRNDTNTEVPLTAMGVGISQVMPLIVACMKEKGAYLEQEFILVEQPELHIHPKLQLRLADLIINSAIPLQESRDQRDTFETEKSDDKKTITANIGRLNREMRSGSDFSYLVNHCQISEDTLDKIIGFDKSKKQLLLETHSEHLVLRFLRRIRESDEGVNVLDREVLPCHVKINCMYKDKGNLQIETMRITRDGDLSSNWPGGFFDERDEELF